MPPLPERLSGDGFFLRPWQGTDASWYLAARDEEIFLWTTEKRGLTLAEAEAAIRQVNAGGEALCFAIVDESSGALAGNIALSLELPQHSALGSAEIMYWLAAEWRGRGLATKAVRLLCGWAFAALGLGRIRLMTLRGNTRSQRVAERAGFRPLEGEPGGEHLWFEQENPLLVG